MPTTVPATDPGLPDAKILDDRLECLGDLIHAAQLCCRASDASEADAADSILRVVAAQLADVRQAIDVCVNAHMQSTAAAWRRHEPQAQA
jgi:hypothetical protein